MVLTDHNEIPCAKRYRRGLLWSVVLLFLACGGSWAEVGSAKLLHTLWTDQELAGRPKDYQISRPYSTPLDLSAPAWTTPHTVLPTVPEVLRNVIRRVRLPGGDKVLALTFDLCERASNRTGYRGDMVTFLRQEGVAATFFAGGKWMRSHPDKALQLMADPLFELGNHSWTHANFALLNEQETREQVLWTQCQYEVLRAQLAQMAATHGLTSEMDLVPAVPHVFRLPYGRNALETLDRLAHMGLPIIQWDVLGEGGAGGPQQIAQRVAQQVRPGSLVLMHANAVPKWIQDIVPYLVANLRRQGWRFVTVSELLRLGEAESVREGYFEKPGDNVQFDSGYPGKGTLHPRKSELF